MRVLTEHMLFYKAGLVHRKREYGSGSESHLNSPGFREKSITNIICQTHFGALIELKSALGPTQLAS